MPFYNSSTLGMGEFIRRTRRLGSYSAGRPNQPPVSTNPSGPTAPPPPPPPPTANPYPAGSTAAKAWEQNNAKVTAIKDQGLANTNPNSYTLEGQKGTPYVVPKEILPTLAQPSMVLTPGARPVVSEEKPTDIPYVLTPKAGPVSSVETPPPGPAVTPPTTSDSVYDSVLKQLADGISSDQPLPGTAAAIQQNRQALAQYAKGAQAAAGNIAAKGGSLNQGTANALGQQTRQDVLTQLGNAEMENTKLVSNEKQNLIDKAIQVGQYGKTLTEGQRQFNENLTQRKTEFDKNFGATEGANYRNQLERLAVDNPVLASKLTNYLLEGKTGALGDFTAEEKVQIQKYATEKKGQQDKLTEVYNKILEGIPGQLQDTQTTVDEGKLMKEYTEKMNTLGANEVLTPEAFNALQASGAIPRYTVSTVKVSKPGLEEILAKSPSGVISIGGEQYKVKEFATEVTGYHSVGIWPKEERRANHTDYFILQDASGKPKYLYKGTLHDEPPKRKE